MDVVPVLARAGRKAVSVAVAVRAVVMAVDFEAADRAEPVEAAEEVAGSEVVPADVVGR